MLRLSIVNSTLVVGAVAATPISAGTLNVPSFPSDAQVVVDGVDTGKVTPMNVVLPAGEHVVTVQMPGSG